MWDNRDTGNCSEHIMQNGPLRPHGGLEIREMFNNIVQILPAQHQVGMVSKSWKEGREGKREEGGGKEEVEGGKEGENGGRKQSKTYILYTVGDEADSKLCFFYSPRLGVC